MDDVSDDGKKLRETPGNMEFGVDCKQLSDNWVGEGLWIPRA